MRFVNYLPLIFVVLIGSQIHIQSAKGGESNVLKEVQKFESVELEVRCQAVLISGKENTIEIIFRNNGDRPIEYLPYAELKAATLQVKCEGHEATSSVLYQSWTNRSVATKTVQPVRLQKGEEARVIVNLSRLFDLSVPGNYEIKVSWTGNYSAGGQAIAVSSKAIQVRVVAENPKPLSEP